MPSHTRAIVRVFLLVLFSLIMLIFRLLFWPVAKVSPKTDRRYRRFLLKNWARVYARIAGIRIVCEGQAPKPPFFLVMNHLSYFDMLVLARETGCVFVSREDVADWPVFGFIAKSLYIIFINRALKRDTVRVNSLIIKTIEEGDGIAIFPEGAVSCGMTVEAFKSPLLQSAIDLNIPVHYAALSYHCADPMPVEGELVSWWRPIPFYVHQYRFLKHPGATATIRFGEEALFDTDRKVLTRRLHEGVLALFTPLRMAAEVYAEDDFPVSTEEAEAPDCIAHGEALPESLSLDPR
ncbi:MAG: 1-acyl-sn-glycerol-3-phosphate acyltransferase [Candidatus Hydrogenedentes bacterium]|jgi:1-acyl-sn-glycerol-3-phosphate acyltransferase|nr:1-acyl-sn-glycerol-3-phosphate acyltransferase [Candidatus Hydrogenedentota bacterium]